MKKNSKGITLIELLVVLTIISILSLVAYAGLSGAREEAKRATVKATMDTLVPAAELYLLQNATYPYTYTEFCGQTAEGQVIFEIEEACKKVYSDCDCTGPTAGACDVTDNGSKWSVQCQGGDKGDGTWSFDWTCTQAGCHE